ncbi:MAG: helix-turn-helix domain-containing protein [Planctomycetaceae bacterium]
MASQNLMAAFCANIRQRRLMLGLTQKQVAEKLGVDTSAYTQLENGRHCPTLKAVEKVANVLQIPPAMLLVTNEPQEALAR